MSSSNSSSDSDSYLQTSESDSDSGADADADARGGLLRLLARHLRRAAASGVWRVPAQVFRAPGAPGAHFRAFTDFLAEPACSPDASAMGVYVLTPGGIAATHALLRGHLQDARRRGAMLRDLRGLPAALGDGRTCAQEGDALRHVARVVAGCALGLALILEQEGFDRAAAGEVCAAGWEVWRSASAGPRAPPQAPPRGVADCAGLGVLTALLQGVAACPWLVESLLTYHALCDFFGELPWAPSGFVQDRLTTAVADTIRDMHSGAQSPLSAAPFEFAAEELGDSAGPGACADRLFAGHARCDPVLAGLRHTRVVITWRACYCNDNAGIIEAQESLAVADAPSLRDGAVSFTGSLLVLNRLGSESSEFRCKVCGKNTAEYNEAKEEVRFYRIQPKTNKAALADAFAKLAALAMSARREHCFRGPAPRVFQLAIPRFGKNMAKHFDVCEVEERMYVCPLAPSDRNLQRTDLFTLVAADGSPGQRHQAYYRLCAACCHLGDAQDSGRFAAFVRRGAEWFEADAGAVSAVLDGDRAHGDWNSGESFAALFRRAHSGRAFASVQAAAARTVFRCFYELCAPAERG